MWWIVLFPAGIIVTISLIAFAIRRIRYDKKQKTEYRPGLDDLQPKLKSGKALLVYSLIFFLAGPMLYTVNRSFQRVEAGHVGVVYQFGGIIGQIPEGPSFIAPWSDVQKETAQVKAVTFPDINAISKETQPVIFDITLNYRVSPTTIQELYRDVGPGWFNELVQARVLTYLKETTATYATVRVAPSREELRIKVRDRLEAELAKYSIDVVDFLIDDLDFHPDFKQAILDKQVAAQQALTEKNKVRAEKFKAQQAVAIAKGESEAIYQRALGQARANERLAKSVTPELIQWQAIQKLADNINVIIAPPGMILDISKLFGTKPLEEETQKEEDKSGGK